MLPKIASGMNHVAYLTEDTAATRRFYEEVLGFPLVAAVRNDYDPESNSTRRSLHTFFAMSNGEAIAFFEIEGAKIPPRDQVPTWARHFAMSVDTRQELDEWHARLREHGIQVTDVVDHDGVWYSIYFMDPNDVLLELTYQSRALTADDAAAAHAMVEEWLANREPRTGSRER
jgi:glyoxylase I family protein